VKTRVRPEVEGIIRRKGNTRHKANPLLLKPFTENLTNEFFSVT
jgi:hypothetical protein